jgi:hypothetical protein
MAQAQAEMGGTVHVFGPELGQPAHGAGHGWKIDAPILGPGGRLHRLAGPALCRMALRGARGSPDHRMKLFFDMNLSPRGEKLLTGTGLEAAHRSRLGPANAPDHAIMESPGCDRSKGGRRFGANAP